MKILNRTLIMLLIYLLFIITHDLAGQDKIYGKNKLIQGIWRDLRYSETEVIYKIIKGINSLGISISSNQEKNIKLNDFFYVNEGLEGFQDYLDTDTDSININDLLKGNGKFYTIVLNVKAIENNFISVDDCIITKYYECSGSNLVINSADYVNESNLPYEALKKLYLKGKLDKRNYIKDYLDIDVKEIKNVKSAIYSKPGTLSRTILFKGDLVTIIGLKGEWYKIESKKNEKVEQGWIMKKDLK